ncbi:glycoside hydrolase family 95 protein [Pseudarthrobacter phenanthrenivorans]|uniref:glycoside hydrolase family 95 protein n=1 Tax=Pseudarthrobacter phenanthrenivorans TaxID=361575 RepID=UPI002F355B11
MSSTNELELDKPASGFINAFPLGNGWLGATIHGRPRRERIDVNVDTFWSGGPLGEPSRQAAEGTLECLRAAIARADFATAEELSKALQGPGFSDSYQPLGWLDWEHANAGDGEYRRVLDLESATATTSYHTAAGAVAVTSFVSSVTGVIVLEASGEGVSEGRLAFHTDHPGVSIRTLDEAEGQWLTATGRAPAHVTPNYVEDDNPVRYAMDAPDENGRVDRGMGFALVAVAQRTGPDSVRLISSAVSGFRGYGARPSADAAALASEAEERVRAAARRKTCDLLAEHTTDHRKYYKRSSLSISGDDRLQRERAARSERLFNFGRYLLISSSRPGTQAANLQGIWNTDVRPGWSCNYTTNINLQMNYWPAEVTGLSDMVEPLTELIIDLAKTGQPIAKQYYQAAGAAIHHNTDLWRFGTPVLGEPAYANWPSALMWLAAHLWERHKFDPSSPGARTKAKKVYDSVTRFALDMLSEDSDGKLVFSPSTSPEHYFVLAQGGTAAVSAGSSIDQELVHETLQRYIALNASEEADNPDPESLKDRATAALVKLRLPSIGSAGELLEWTDERQPGEPGHRHLSHLYGVYPGNRITRSKAPAEFEAARTALRLRLDAGSGYTGWSQSWVLCLAARLGDSSLAAKALDTLADELCSESLLDLHPHPEWPGGYIFQIDGNFGAVAGMAEMLVQSHDDRITLLPALPPDWTKGTATGLRTRGGHIIDLDWNNGHLTGCTILAGKSGPLAIDIRVGQKDVIEIHDEGKAPLKNKRMEATPDQGQKIEWNAEKGHKYAVKLLN